MKTIAVTISGVAPLLMARFATGVLDEPRQDGEKPTPRAAAEKAAYKDEKGHLYMPGQNVYAAIIAAGRFHKKGRSSLTTARTSLIPGGMWLQDLMCYVKVEGKKTKHFEIDSRRVVNPNTGQPAISHRPRIDQWDLSFTLQVDETMFALHTVRKVVDDAFSKIGIGSFRPERKGAFGRAVVVAWKVSNGAPIEEAKLAMTTA